MKLSLALITLNEECKLEACLASVPFADEIVIVDSGSKDRTREVAGRFKARWIERAFDNFSNQKNAAIDSCRGEWILLLDADERLSDGLREEIQAVIQDPNAAEAYFIRRRNYLFGRLVKHGSNTEDWQLRLLRRGAGRFKGLVHERVEARGRVERLRNDLLHYSYQTVSEYAVKFPRFSSLDAETQWRQGRRPTWAALWLKPPVHFLYFYFVKLGFLDGRAGLLYQLLAARYLFVKQRKALALYREKGPFRVQEEVHV